MNKLLIVSAVLAGIAGSSIARADTHIVIAPEVDTWVMTQPDTSVTYEGEIGVGTAFPDTVTFIEVPNQRDFAFVVVNNKRVLVERKTRKVIKIYQ